MERYLTYPVRTQVGGRMTGSVAVAPCRSGLRKPHPATPVVAYKPYWPPRTPTLRDGRGCGTAWHGAFTLQLGRRRGRNQANLKQSKASWLVPVAQLDHLSPCRCAVPINPPQERCMALCCTLRCAVEKRFIVPEDFG